MIYPIAQIRMRCHHLPLRSLSQHKGRALTQRNSSFSNRSLDSSYSSSNFFDVAIVGGGVVGSSLAHLLQRRMPALHVALLDSRQVAPQLQPPSQQQCIPNPRSYALSPKSLDILGESIVSQLPLGRYDSMQVWQAKSPAVLTFTSRDLEADPSKGQYLGACCEDEPLVATLWDALTQQNQSSNSSNGVECFTGAGLNSLCSGDPCSLATVEMDDGNVIRAAVLVGADGANSWVRKTTGISRIGGDYEQSALTFTVSLKDSMRRRAFQRYLDDGGPMALLPTHSPEHAVVVWSTTPEKLSKWKEAPEGDLVAHLNDCLQEGPQRVPSLLEGRITSSSDNSIFSRFIYGTERVLDTLHYGLAMASQHPDPTFQVPPLISGIVSLKYTFPLSCFQSTSYVKGRVALVGDAAHTVHPMAGQGLNLGLGDVEILTDCLEKAHRAGMDLSSFFDQYHSRRHKTVSISLGGIHLLQRIFRNQEAASQHIKTFGMNMIQNVGSLRRQLAVAAAHGVAL